jgi:hypothetical protein
MKKKEFTAAVKRVFDACRKLSKVSGSKRQFTPDGRMVGDIGEVIADFFYGVILDDVGSHDWDGTYKGRKVQVKATGGDDTYLKNPLEKGDGLMLVFHIDRKSGYFKNIYNGDIKRVWNALTHKKATKSGEKMISLKQLIALQGQVNPRDIIPTKKR